MPQFSGPFKPRPALTTISASGNATLPLAMLTSLVVSLSVLDASAEVIVPAPAASLMPMALGTKLMIGNPLFNEIVSIPLEEKAPRSTVTGLVLVGVPVVLVLNAPLVNAARVGAIIFPMAVPATTTP